jgi:replicative DNA helicase Mcm
MKGLRTDLDKSKYRDLIDDCTDFLASYAREDVAEAAKDNEDSITVAYRDVYQFSPDLADDLITHPRTVIGALRSGIRDVDVPLPNASDALDGVDVRIRGVTTHQPIVSELRNDRHRTNYVGLRGQVSLATQVKPKLMAAMFECQRCDGVTIGPIDQTGEGLDTPRQCPSCSNNGPYELLQDKSVYLDHQIVELSDPPGENPGETGNVVPVHLYGELSGRVQPGDRVQVNGVVETPQTQINATNQKVDRRQDWQLIGHAIDEEETAFEDVEPERVDEITEISQRDDVQELFIRSAAPDILTGDRGDKHKLAWMLSLFGGASDEGRDDINVFYIGAPGTGKSAYLERARKLAPKSVMASGKGATAAGLTATATKSETTGKWMLDAGALVLASGGVACIDEFDKMADSVRQSMHEAMENQQVPINKAGINTTLTTETTVLAAANPKGGSFDRYQPLNEQVEIGSPLLSRFDLIFGVSDSVSENRDTEIARHQHSRIDTDNEQPLDDELITEYIAYARQNVNPTYESDAPKDALVDYYVEKRQESDGSDEDGVTPVTPRMNDALRRLAQASARMHLRDEITMADAETAMELMDMTLGDTALEADGTLNGGKMEGRNRTQAERVDAILTAIHTDPKTPATVAQETGIDEDKVEHRLSELYDAGDVVQPETGKFRSV